VWIGPLVVDQIRELVEESEIMREDDEKWPRKNVVGRQELEIRLGNEHISFEVGGEGRSAKATILITLLLMRRPQRSERWWTCRIQTIPKVCVYSTIWCKT
jgi:hypothetical protein